MPLEATPTEVVLYMQEGCSDTAFIISRSQSCFSLSSISLFSIYILSHRPMSTDIWVFSYEHLKDHPRSGQALTLLQKVASRVKPIMRKHSWRLPVLAEFFPDSPSLVGMIPVTILYHPKTCLNIMFV